VQSLQPALGRMSRRGFIMTAAGAGILSAVSCRGPAEAPPASGLTDFAERIIKDKRAPGVVIAHGKAGGAAEFVVRGNLAFDSKRLVDQDTLWRIYSMTKPITGMAAMILVSENQLNLDQPVADFIPAFAKIKVSSDGVGLPSIPAMAPVTVRHLLTHTSGLIYGEFTSSPISDAYLKLGVHPLQTSRADQRPVAPSLAEFAERVATLPLVCEPGTNWVYGVGLDVLGRVIEVASGEAFDQFLKRRIFDPLGMSSTFFTVPQTQAERLATSYERRRFSVDVLDPRGSSVYLRTPSFPFGGSGLVSSAREYDRFLAMIGNRGMLDGVHILHPDAVALGTANLAPEGADLSGLRSTTGNPSEGQGAGGSVVMDGPAVGTFGWAGMAGTVGAANVRSGARYSGYFNVVGDTTLVEKLGPAILREPA
jgi:CubicO group peptidase (beta-lactamase class C family)